ncbi:MATE family efflux transporter [Streptomyces sp. H39-S7]|uniref:MATE family efflux transporter n=1 Tax=Streptomyces sp. H39-S7 TaxID=3004357 RepID=UPI0022AE5E06|nr:MATE family efflux transporter [Streptomyces sp. H39-S7]MCZ4124599.1 MATE family efflux transporter [Streptomyces sp. H39-S7]
MKRGRLVSLAVPVYFELLAGVVAGIMDVLWVARLGGAAVAAVAVATNVENVLLGVIMMAASGTTVLVAHAVGARDPGAVRSAVRGGWALFALITPAVAIGGWWFREPVARLVLGGHDGHVLSLTVGYFAISLPGVAVFFAQNVLDGILKGVGDTRIPMRLSFLGNGLILVLDPLLIHGLLGLPQLGIRGAALATVIGRVVALAVGVAALRRNRLLREAVHADPVHGTVAALRRTAATGLPMSGDFLVRMAGSLAMISIVARLGVSSVAAYGIATKAMYVATMSFYAVRQAASILTAHALGGGRDQRVAIGRQSVLTGGALGAGAALVLLVAAPWVMRASGAQGEVAAAGTLFLRCLGPYLVLLACLIALGGVFQGSGGGRQLVHVTLAGVGIQLPLAYALSGLGLPGVCLAMGLSAALQCAAVAGLFLRVTRQREASAGARMAAMR